MKGCVNLETTIQQLKETAKYIQDSYPEDSCLILIDTEKVVEYLPGENIDLKIRVGDPLSTLEGTVTLHAMRTERKQKEEKDSTKFGVAYIATSSPIKKDGKVIGVLTSVMSNQKLDVLRTEAEELTAISENLSVTSEKMADVSSVIAKDLQNLADESAYLKSEINTIETILTKIKDTAIKSRILGLNASIEAARSGEHGKGFTVVANEIKKMADNSKDSVEGFEPKLQEMIKNIESVIETIQNISSHSQEQSAMMQEFHSAFEHIVHAATELSNNAKL